MHLSESGCTFSATSIREDQTWQMQVRMLDIAHADIVDCCFAMVKMHASTAATFANMGTASNILADNCGLLLCRGGDGGSDSSCRCWTHCLRHVQSHGSWNHS